MRAQRRGTASASVDDSSTVQLCNYAGRSRRTQKCIGRLRMTWVLGYEEKGKHDENCLLAWKSSNTAGGKIYIQYVQYLE